MNEEEIYNLLKLRRKPLVGDRTIRLLLQHFGSAREVLAASEKKLLSIDGLGAHKVKAIKAEIDDAHVVKEMQWMEKHDVKCHSIMDDSYPKNLRMIEDAPSLIFSKGNVPFNEKRIVAIVGTRLNTENGSIVTGKIIEDLAIYDVLILSGMAYGIDIIAHKVALQNNLSTVGVLAHGLDILYPTAHRNVANEMIETGGLITEYSIGTKLDKNNFPMRNRIVAGMCDVLLVVETEEKGGSMITAKLASSYNKDVTAIPGRVSDKKSSGCNYLIKTNIAQLVENGDDIAELMGWKVDDEKKKAIQQQLFADLLPSEEKIVQIILEKENIHIDELALKSKMDNSALASALLNLELNNIIKSLSGKRYRVI